MDSRLIGRMVLARWLDYPPDRYERLVEAVTSSPIYLAIASRIEVAQLPGTVTASATCAVARLISDAGREADGREADGRETDGRETHPYSLAYRHAAWGKEFRVDGCAPTTGHADPELDWLLRRLRPINTRNRLTHLILLAVAEAQAAFLRSGAWADLAPLTLSGLCRRLGNAERPMGLALPPGLRTLDASLISRAARGLTVEVLSGEVLPLRSLLPNGQVVLRHRLQALLDDEALELTRGQLDRPRSDEALRRQVQGRWEQAVSRRTVAAARQALGIPAAHRRAGRPIYPPPGFDFSAFRSLTPEALLAHAPPGPGVYEIALSDRTIAYPHRASAVIYLGRSQNLRKRLRAHQGNHTKFGPEIAEGHLVFRFAVVGAAHLREAEARLAQTFYEAHGALPCYNAVMPSGARRHGEFE